MKDLLKKLTREELQELGKKYIPNYSNKFSATVLISKLSNLVLDEEDKAWVEQAVRDAEMDEAVEEEQKVEKAKVSKPSVDTRYYDENTGRALTSIEIEQKAKVQGEQLLRQLVAQARTTANKTVIALVNPANQEDINLQKTCESFITGNSYFTISVVVPFGTYVEIPRAIAEVIREATCPQVIELNEFQRKQLDNKPLAVINSIRKYNIQVWTKEQFANMQAKIPD